MWQDRRGTPLLGWWYVCIGLGFALLAVRSLLLGGRMWMLLLRCVIAAGFLLLGYAALRRRPR